MDSLESVSPTKQTLTTTYQHIWGYFKKNVPMKSYISI
nr:YbgA family protein [Lacticaseibacillus paracasei]